ncbi:hypothetical protein OIU79_012579 [Salix purpurea]|uniref:Zinc transporter n=1 Tax=Salix purpurea TaxID=77065 RepID=A0A9Q0T3H9_SALPP|nr:hypothetical protein OIU79_012579 [Salix purpurea]
MNEEGIRFRGCFRLLCFIAFWSWAIAWWLHSCCICSRTPCSACPSHGRSIWHCLYPCCLATSAATRLFKDGVLLPHIFAFPWEQHSSMFSSSSILKLAGRKKASVNNLPTVTGFPVSVHTLQSFLSCGAVAFHALAEGLALGVAAPKAYGLGRHMVLPVSLHGLPRGAAVASCIFGATDSWHSAIAAATLIGFVGPISAIGAILAGIDYSGLDHVMVFACGGLIPSFGNIIKRGVRLDARKGGLGLVIGAGFASLCLMCTKLVCLHTPYCNSAPEAVR